MPIETFILAVFKIGLLTALGQFIDFMMDKPEKKRLRDWLSRLVLKLEYGRWEALGAEEARAALKAWDYVVGPRLISAQRLVTSIYVMVLATAWTSSTGGAFIAMMTWLFRDGTIPDEARGVLIQMFVLSPLLLTVMVALSLSFTRFLSNLALKQAGGIATYLMLLIANVALFLLWQPLMTTFYVAVVSWWMNHELISILTTKAGISGWYAIVTGSFAEWPSSLLQLQLPQDFASFLINGLRIAFSLAFVLSFALRSYVRATILRLGYAIVDSDKPIFTLVLGGLTALAVLCHELIKLMGQN
ncbi:hypothetical protein [Reyranella sp.]|uniref:hypothetical protein n=1 Tax=Reyranella sp. TaxID=1929291 RepID=UPI003BA9C278